MSGAGSDRRVVALDLGSTSIKGAGLDAAGRLEPVESIAAPPPLGSDRIREGDPADYRRAAEAVLGRVLDGGRRDVPLGVASQRSTFVLWRRDNGEPVTALISWQDRRAADWCRAHGDDAATIRRVTGLVLSAHYVGPKLAALQEASPALRRQLHDGDLLFGNLDAWLLWCWSDGRRHETDFTMAARTAMVDLDRGDWSAELLAMYDVPLHALPQIVNTVRPPRELRAGPAWSASIGDQAAGALTVLGPNESSVLVTLGTGAFVIRPLPGPLERRDGYLTAPILRADSGDIRWGLEGSINGAGSALDRYGRITPDFRVPAIDSHPEAFCIPDTAGLGAPHWRPDVGLTLNAAARRTEGDDRRWIVRQGLIFRIRQVLDDLCPQPPDRVLLSGGVARDPWVRRGLAVALARPVELLDQPQAGLTGIGRLAAGLDPFTAPRADVTDPPQGWAGLADKYLRWRAWLQTVLDR